MMTDSDHHGALKRFTGLAANVCRLAGSSHFSLWEPKIEIFLGAVDLHPIMGPCRKTTEGCTSLQVPQSAGWNSVGFAGVVFAGA